MKTLQISIITFLIVIFSTSISLAQLKMNNFIGVNMHAKGHIEAYRRFSFLREFHNWGSNIRNESEEVQSPTKIAKYEFNPLVDESALINSNDYYKKFGPKISPALMEIAPQIRGITKYLSDCSYHHTEKPIYFEGLKNYIDPYKATCADARQFIQWMKYDLNVEEESVGIGSIEDITTENFGVSYHVEPWNDVDVFIRIDWNDDGDFQDDHESVLEKINYTVNDNSAHDYTFHLTNADLPHLTAHATSGLHVMRIVIHKHLDPADPFDFVWDNEIDDYKYKWFHGDAVDIPIYYCNGSDYFSFINSKVYGYDIETNTSLHITNVEIPTDCSYSKGNTGYKNFLNDLHYANLTPNETHKFIATNSSDTPVSWDIKLDGTTLWSSSANASEVEGTFTVGDIGGGIHQLRIRAGSNITYLFTVNEGTGCSINAENHNAPPVPLDRFFLDPLVNQEAPATYVDYALYNSLFAAKYGKGSTHYEDFEELINPTETDMGTVPKLGYIEVGNEEDAYWWESDEQYPNGSNYVNTQNAQIQMLPEMYGAMLSAAYDGGCGTMTWENSAHHDVPIYGIHNVAPGVKVVNAGLTGLRGKYVLDMIKYFEKTRTDASCNGNLLPFDVLNFHHYVTEPNAEANGTESAIHVNWRQMFDTYTHAPNLLNSLGVSPEEGKLKEMMEWTFSAIKDEVSTDIWNELKKKEVWLSEFGYGTTGQLLGDGLWGGVPAIGDNGSFQKTQAQWIVRSYLELAAANVEGMNVDRAILFEVEDKLTGGESGIFDNYGLIKDKVHNFQPKKSWYHVQTMRRTLGRTKYQGEIPGHVMNFPEGETWDLTPNARIQHYKGKYTSHNPGETHENVDILAIWSPNSTDGKGELTLNFGDIIHDDDGNSLTFTSLTIITPRDGDAEGEHKGYTFSGNTFTFDASSHYVTETPMYVVLGVDETNATFDCPDFQILNRTCSSVDISWSYIGSNIIDFYIKEGNSEDDFDLADPDLRFIASAVRGTSESYHIGALKTNTDYRLYAVISRRGFRLKAICSKNFSTNTNGLCLLSKGVDFTVESGTNNGNFEQAFDYTDYDCTAFGDTDGDGFINGADADDNGDNIIDPGSTDVYHDQIDPNKIEDSWEVPNVLWYWGTEAVIKFNEKVDLRSIGFMHNTGNGGIKIEYKKCACGSSCGYESNWITYAEITPDGYMNWIEFGKKVNNVTRLRFSRIESNGNGIAISKLSICGDMSSEPCPHVECDNGPSRIPWDPKIIFADHFGDGGETSFSFDPVFTKSDDPATGYNKQYEAFYQIDDETNDFSEAAYNTGYLYEGFDRIDIPMKGLQLEKKYKVYLRSLPEHPCYSDTRPPKDVELPKKLMTKEVTADSIFHFTIDSEGKVILPNDSGDSDDNGSDDGGSDDNDNNGNDNQVESMPNPTSGSIQFKWAEAGYKSLIIVDQITGSILETYQIDPASTIFDTDVSNLNEGTYIVKLEGTETMPPIQGTFVKIQP